MTLALEIVNHQTDGWDTKYHHITVRPVFYNGSTERLDFPSFASWERGDGDLEGFQITCQQDSHGGTSYAWSAEYHLDRIGVTQAQVIAKVLTKLDKGLTKLEETYGQPASFSAYVLRVAKALKIHTFVTRSEMVGGYRAMNPSSAAYHIDTKEREFSSAYSKA